MDLVDSTGNGVLDTFLHYGLFLGAIFQLVCIFAVIFVPSKGDEDKVCCFCVSCYVQYFSLLAHHMMSGVGSFFKFSDIA